MTSNYVPKTSIELRVVESLIDECDKALNHSLQTQSWISNNPHEHMDRLRKVLSLVSKTLKELPKDHGSFNRIIKLTEEMEEIQEEDEKWAIDQQELLPVKDVLLEFFSELENALDYEEEYDPFPITAEERLNQAWEQKMEAKG
tara:strand:+ start:125 stop:556 length:432 start_codon:yes stop_codon:yes gene_type:complete